MKNNIIIATFFIWMLVCNFLIINASILDESSGENSDLDSDDLILKMKSFFDTYASKLKNNMNGVDKLLVPGDKSLAVYTKNYNLQEFSHQARDYLENFTDMRRKDLKLLRDSKQNSEERNIDLLTKNKILKSRLSIAENEKNKMQSDFNEKNNFRTIAESLVKTFKDKRDRLIIDNKEKLQSLKQSSREYDNTINKLDLNQKIFEEELLVKNGLEQVSSEIFKKEFEKEFLKNLNTTQFEFIGRTTPLKDLFQKETQKLQDKNLIIQSNINNKTESIENFRKGLQSKYDVYSNLNETINKLHKIQDDYKEALRNSEETLNRMKSKKNIIEENITEKLKRRRMRKETVENVLNKLEKELDQYNVDKINVNKYRKDIQTINSRLRNILSRENMIFKKNKIKF
jgi:hypothetical protein